MTPDELRALADALEPMARAPRFEDFDVPGFCAWVRACADAKPLPGLAPTHRCPACGALWRQCDDASWNLRSASCCGLCDAGRVELVCWLDEPKREPLSDERIDEIGDPFGYFQYGDAQGDKRRAFARAIERAAYERAAALVIELREDRTVADAIRALRRQHD